MSVPSRYLSRREQVYRYLRRKSLDTAVLVDLEGSRNRSLRYLCGHPQDALLFLFAEGRAALLPWDVAMAERYAAVEAIVPYTRYQRLLPRAISAMLGEAGLEGGRIELSGKLPYPVVREISAAASSAEFICRKDGIDSLLLDLRSIKDEAEIENLRRAAEITNRILAGIERLLEEEGDRLTELKLALFIESEARSLGAEGLGFETVVAGPKRSFGIHAFPSYTAAPFGGQGFSLVDFGVTVAGYTSDVTLAAIRGPLSSRQEQMVQAVQESYDLAISLAVQGQKPSRIAWMVEQALSRRGFEMVHGLGHGVGLDAHESPLLRSDPRSGDERALEDGMVFTLEPGLYDPACGGVRLENDILLVGGEVEVLTRSRIVRFR